MNISNLAKERGTMKKTAVWLTAISITVFVIAWGVMGLKIFNNDYLITPEAYIGLISLIVCFICILYIKFTNRCPHCGKLQIPFGRYSKNALLYKK